MTQSTIQGGAKPTSSASISLTPVQVPVSQTPTLSLSTTEILTLEFNANDFISDTIYENLRHYRPDSHSVQKAITNSARNFDSIVTCFKAAGETLAQHGAAIIDHTSLTDLALLRQWCSSLGTPMNYEGGTNVRQAQGDNVLSVGTEPPWANIATHNKMSYAYRYPECFVIGCQAASPNIAPTMAGDNQLMTHLLMSLPLGDKLQRLGVRYIRNFHDAKNSQDVDPAAALSIWQDVFNTAGPYEVPSRARTRLSGDMDCELLWLKDGKLRLTYQATAFEYDPKLNENLCFVSIGNHGYWFRQWAPFNTLPNRERPFHLQFGNGSEFSEVELEQMAIIGNASSFPIHWQAGRIALLDNRRYTHARPQYNLPKGGIRKLGVVLLNPVQRQGPR
jgi:hypothetical protein